MASKVVTERSVDPSVGARLLDLRTCRTSLHRPPEVAGGVDGVSLGETDPGHAVVGRYPAGTAAHRDAVEVDLRRGLPQARAARTGAGAGAGIG